MKMKLLLATLTMSLIASACAPTMKFDQTCLTCVKSQRFSGQVESYPKSFLSSGECIVTMVETGENVYLNEILKEEKITPVAGIPVAMAKLNGKIYLTGNGFGQLWIVYPRGDNEAKYKSIDLPIEKLRIDEPVFAIDSEKYMLKMSAQNLQGITYVLIDDKKWVPENSGKAGE